ncbi:mitogen-activated protein kinase kinase kinase 1-like [Bidens hawaiensis]|uniref:mitogen-activated protein kinase kinase kinase 1-like n=1 Tax=Bidens hawaiensis TaxID=980011 RepID=UPI00404ACA96
MSSSSRHRRSVAKLDRKNAAKNIEYDASISSSHRTRSLDSSLISDQTSFRIEGNIDGEFDLICRSLGLSGPEAFSIPAADWKARKTYSPTNKNNVLRSVRSEEVKVEKTDDEVSLCGVSEGCWKSYVTCQSGIKGVRPPVLATPPVILPVVADDSIGSNWGFASMVEEVTILSGPDAALNEDAVEDVEDDEDELSSNAPTEFFSLSPNGPLKCSITNWQKGDFLGRGSYGTVYEGYTEHGLFFAVKEVSLHEEGLQGKQSIVQLEQEISLLSQFQHENIVRYLGTDTGDGKLYIFLELVTKGSLASLYHKYHLGDSQVTAYTRQILGGLNYLHERNVVHRDIKCANILVDASGSVKLADFGLAKATKLNDIKSCKGTPYWMAPEVVNGKNNGYGLAADIWSLGCTVLEMLTSKIPYSHLEGMQALFRIGRGELPPIPEALSLEAQDFIRKCLQVNQNDRPTAAQLLMHPFVKDQSL